MKEVKSNSIFIKVLILLFLELIPTVNLPLNAVVLTTATGSCPLKNKPLASKTV